MNNLVFLTNYALDKLKDTYNEREIRSLCKIIFQHELNLSRTEQIIKAQDPVSEEILAKFKQIILQLLDNRPIQYIIGNEEFCGLTFQLNESTLIPRPETEELVMLAIELAKPHAKVLDIGTGSGCIAISVAKNRPDIDMQAVDISEQALEAATKNANNNDVNVQFNQIDILQHATYQWSKYDMIISNPPYVRECEKLEMHSRVLNFEPHRALFVSDHDPLIFYRTIAQLAQQQLNPEGYLLFEINEYLGEEMQHLLESLGFHDVSVRTDIFDKQRIVIAKK